MSLQFVFGRAGSGKSEYICSDAIKSFERGKNAVIIVPEQYSHQRERDILEKTGFICEGLYVTSFNRLAHKMITDSGFKKPAADDSVKAMMVSRAITKCSTKLTYFKNAHKQSGYIGLFADAISEFKKGQVMPETLRVIAEETDDALFSARLFDLSMIYEEYNKLISISLSDADDNITMMASLCFGNEYITNAVIYIDEFFRFTKNELFCIESMLASGATVVVSLCMEETADDGVFSIVDSTRKALIKCAENVGVNVGFPVVMKDIVRFKTPELKALEEAMADSNAVYEGDVSNVTLTAFKNRYDEVTQVASAIRGLISSGYTYRDIAVLSGDYEGYKDIVSSIFSLYDIPVFCDNRKKFSEHPVVIYLFAVMDLLLGYTTDKILVYMKSGFADITPDEASKLENYAYASSINYNDWLDDERFLRRSSSVFGREEDSGEEGKRQAEIKNRLLAPVIALKEKIMEAKSVSARSSALLEFLQETDLEGKIKVISDRYTEEGNLNKADEYAAIYNIIIETLEDMKTYLGDENAGITVLKEIMEAGFSQKTIGIIPKLYDSISFGDLNRSVIKNSRALFLIGTNEGQFPNVPSPGILLSDSEREYLSERGVSVAPDSRKLIEAAEFSVYESVNTATEKLFVSYAIDCDGQGLRPASFVAKLKRTFPRLCVTSYLTDDELPPEVSVASKASAYTYVLTHIHNLEENSLAKRLFDELSKDEEYSKKLERAVEFSRYENTAGRLSYDAVSALYGKNMTGSVSRFERFSSCPFSFFIQYGLRAREREIMKIEAVDIGSLLHEVVEKFSLEVKSRGVGFGTVTKQEQKEICSAIIDEMFEAMSIKKIFAKGRIEALKRRLVSLVAKSVGAICEHVARGEFEPVAFELSFDKNGDISPVTIELSTGETITMIGKIDRVDTYSHNGELYIKVIDYKSGKKGYSLADIFNRTTLQLSVYMMALTENGKEIFGTDQCSFGGMFYFKLDDPIEERLPDKEQDEDKVLRAFKMSGLVSENRDIINAMDKGISGWSAVIPVYIKADGSVSYTQSKLASKEQYEKLTKYVRRAVSEIGKEIISGNIEINPIRNGDITPCSYCRFRTICGFDNKVHPCRYTKKFASDDEIWEAMSDAGENSAEHQK